MSTTTASTSDPTPTSSYLQWLYEYRLVNSVCSQVTVYYSRAKSSSSVLKNTLSIAENRAEAAKQKILEYGAFGTARLNSLSKTFYGQKTVSGVNSLLSTADRAVDRYLSNDSGEEVEEGVEDEELRDPSETVLRAGALANKVRRRVVAKAAKDVNNARKRLGEAFGKMATTLDLISYARRHLESAKEAAVDVRDTFLKNLDTTDGSRSEDNKLLTSVRLRLEKVMRASLAASSTARHHLPNAVQASLDHCQKQLGILYDNIRQSDKISDLSASVISEARRRVRAARAALQAARAKLTEWWMADRRSREEFEMMTMLEQQPGEEDGDDNDEHVVEVSHSQRATLNRQRLSEESWPNLPHAN